MVKRIKKRKVGAHMRPLKQTTKISVESEESKENI